MPLPFKQLGPGDVGLVMQSEDGTITQLGLTGEQSQLLQLFVGSLSAERPLIQLPKKFNLKLIDQGE